MKYILFNLHTHCHYCDGSGEPEKYVEEAIRLGFHALGFSSHAPVPFENKFAIQNEEYLLKYADEIRLLKKQYISDINIYLALEADFIPGITKDFNYLRNLAGLEYMIGGIHLVKNPEKADIWFIDGPRRETYDEGLKYIFNGDIEFAVTSYWKQIREMISTQDFEIIAHLDKIKMHNQNRFFTEDEPWYRKQLNETLELIAEKQIIVEVNTRGLYKKRSDELFPGVKALRLIHQLGIPVTLNSDAHKPEELSNEFDFAKNTLREVGFRKLMLIGRNGWEEVGL
nr:histidinol-phosphatase [Bacteroidota bacterium]